MLTRTPSSSGVSCLGVLWELFVSHSSWFSSSSHETESAEYLPAMFFLASVREQMTWIIDAPVESAEALGIVATERHANRAETAT
jgi:hypothetical protein